MNWLMVALGGAAGSVLRYGAHRMAVNYAGADTVLGTLAVNLTGSFILGFLATMLIGRFSVPEEVRNLLTVGLLGGFTTFSALSYQTVYLMDKGVVWPALASLSGNVVLGLAVAYLGVGLAKSL
jgi:CrcB protein